MFPWLLLHSVYGICEAIRPRSPARSLKLKCLSLIYIQALEHEIPNAIQAILLSAVYLPSWIPNSNMADRASLKNSLQVCATGGALLDCCHRLYLVCVPSQNYISLVVEVWQTKVLKGLSKTLGNWKDRYHIESLHRIRQWVTGYVVGTQVLK